MKKLMIKTFGAYYHY